MKRRFPALVFACSLSALVSITACTRPPANQNAPATANSNQAAANGNASQQQRGAPMAAPTATPATDPARGNIKVTSTPAGAVILLIAEGDGSAGVPQRKGSTPATLTDIEPGKYTIALEKLGYKAFQKEIQVDASKTVNVAASLRKQ
jgi:hypothetical protein